MAARKELMPAESNDTQVPRLRVLERLKSDADFRRPRLLGLSMAAEIVLGLLAFALAAPHFEGEIGLFLILLSLNLAAERMPISIYGDSLITVGFVFTLPIIALFGPAGGAIVGPLEAVARRLGKEPVDVRLFRNACRGAATYALAGVVYALFATVNPETIGYEMIPAGLAATAVTFGLSALLISSSVSLRTGQSFSTVWANHRWVALHYLGFGIVGLSFLASYVGLGYWGLLGYLIPAFMLRFSTKQYVDKTAENVEKLKQQNRALETANVEIRKVSDELRVTYNATLEALVNALEARDQETKGHSVRVAEYMTTIAEALGVRRDTQEWLDMQHGALLHDVGKIGVRDSILLKPGKLTPEEWEFMRKHPEIGYNILREVKFLHGAAEIVLAHHERWDGNGYPKGLRAEEIPLGSRIFMVVDTFDTMTSDRVYRKALTTQDALDEILRCSGSQFDPLVVEAFLDIYDAWVLERQKLHDLTILPKAA
jgi:putative nucleotidyltransferase with HDIG domain